MKFEEFSDGCPKKKPQEYVRKDKLQCDLFGNCEEKNCVTFHAAKKIRRSIIDYIRRPGWHVDDEHF